MESIDADEDISIIKEQILAMLLSDLLLYLPLPLCVQRMAHHILPTVLPRKIPDRPIADLPNVN